MENYISITKRLAAGLLLAVLLLAGCSGPAGNGNPTTHLDLSLSSTHLTVAQGGTATVQLTVDAGGYSGYVALTLSSPNGGAAPSGITFSPPKVAVPGGPYTLTFAASSSVAPGDYALVLTGTTTGAVKKVNLTLTVEKPGFSLALDPASLSILQGGNSTTTLTITPAAGFAGSVSLSLRDADGNPASGISLSPSTISVQGTTTRQLSIQVAPERQPGSLPLKLHASGGGQSAEADLDLSVNGFTMSLGNTEVFAAQGESAGVTLTVNAAGVSGDMSLTLEQQDGSGLPAGISLDQPSITVPGGPYSLTISVGSAVATGTYNLRLVGSLNGLEHSVDFSLTVQPPPEYDVSLDSANMNVAVGGSDTHYLTIHFNQDFNDTITLVLESADGSPAPAAFSISPTSMGMSVSAGNDKYVSVTVSVGNEAEAGNYGLRIRVSSTNTTRYAPFTLTVPQPPDFTIEFPTYSHTVINGGSVEYPLNVYPHNGYSGTVNLDLVSTGSQPLPSGVTFEPHTIDLSNGAFSGSLTVSADSSVSVDDYYAKLRVYDDQAEQTADLKLAVEDFGISFENSTPSLAQDAGGQSNLSATINVQRDSTLDAFPNPVYLTLDSQDGSSVPQGLSIQPTSASVPSDSNYENISITVATTAGTPAGSYSLRLVATAAGVSRSADFTLNVRSFDVALSSDSLAFWTEGSGNVDLTLTPQQGFSGTVDLSLVDASDNPVSGISLSPASVSVSSTMTQTLTITADAGVAAAVYPLRLKAVSGSIVKYADLTLSVEDFDISLDATSVTLDQGGQQTPTLTITPSGGFSGDVSLLLTSDSSLPSGVILSPDSLTVSGPLTQPLTFTAASGATPGSFNVNLAARATLGGVTRERAVPLTLEIDGVNISVSPSSLALARGDSRTLQLTVESYGVNGSLPLSLQDASDGAAPSGITLSPGSISVSDGSASYTLTVSADGTVDYGTKYEDYPLSVSTTWNSLTKNADFDLFVYHESEYWTPRNSNTSYSLRDVAYNGDDTNPLYVAVGGGTTTGSGYGVAVYSSDAHTWQGGTSVTQNELWGVGYGNGAFVAVGSTCEIATSSDGQSWTTQASPGAFDCPTGGGLYDVAYDDASSKFVAVGSGGLIVTGTASGGFDKDADASAYTSEDLHGIAGSGGYLVAVGNAGTVLVWDGSSWTQYTSASTGTSADLVRVAYGGGSFLAVAADGNTLTISIDGSGTVSFSPGSLDASNLNTVTGIAYGPDWDGTGIFVVTVQDSNYGVYTSSDGQSWSAQSTGDMGGKPLGAGYGNHHYVVVGEDGALATSP